MKLAKKILRNYDKVDFVTSHNVLAHISNNKEVFRSIYYLLKNNGYFCFEVGYFFNVLKKIISILFIMNTLIIIMLILWSNF